jgi:hypothetical protein
MMTVLAVGTALAPAFAGNVTVGRFYSEVARAKHLVCSDAASAEANLRGAGFNLPTLAIDKSLTEGDMAAISNALGVTVKTQQPAQPISESLLDTYISAFGSQLRARAGKIGTPFTVYDGRDQGGDHDHDHDHDHEHQHSSCHP